VAEAADAAVTPEAAEDWAAGFEQATSAAAQTASVTRFARFMSSSPDAELAHFSGVTQVAPEVSFTVTGAKRWIRLFLSKDVPRGKPCSP
jgi:hypothetical protein